MMGNFWGIFQGYLKSQNDTRNPLCEKPTLWFSTEIAWSRVHVDFAGPINGAVDLELVDSHSKELLFLFPTIGEQFSITVHYQAENNVSACFFCSSNVTSQGINIVDRTPEDKTYDTLKRAVISHLSDSQKKRLQPLLLQIDLGDHTPS
ncbi:hypothetical protein ACTXT7_016930 [Hymenolepis weldensis]